MKIIADESIPFVAECFSSLGKVEAVPGREITPALISDADILLVPLLLILAGLISWRWRRRRIKKRVARLLEK